MRGSKVKWLRRLQRTRPDWMQLSPRRFRRLILGIIRGCRP